MNPVTQHPSVCRDLRRLGRQFRGLRDAVLVLDDEGVVADANTAATQIFAGNASALRQRHVRELIQFSSNGNGAGWRAASLHRPLQLTAQRLNGDTFPVEVTMSDCGDGCCAATVAVVRDLSERQRIFEITAQRERLADIGQLTAEVAHEISRPITGIRTLIDDLLVTCRDDDRETLELVKTEAQRASALIHEVLLFARRDTSKPVIELNELVERATNLFALRNRRRVNITIDRVLSDEPTPIHGQPCQLEQVVLNLLENAAHAIADRAEGQIGIRTRVEEAQVILEVSDNGGGIPPEILERIFEPFFTTKERGVGTGLGLAIVDSIVREHGGTLTVCSRPGELTTFVLAFPKA